MDVSRNSTAHVVGLIILASSLAPGCLSDTHECYGGRVFARASVGDPNATLLQAKLEAVGLEARVEGERVRWSYAETSDDAAKPYNGSLARVAGGGSVVLVERQVGAGHPHIEEKAVAARVLNDTLAAVGSEWHRGIAAVESGASILCE